MLVTGAPGSLENKTFKAFENIKCKINEILECMNIKIEYERDGRAGESRKKERP